VATRQFFVGPAPEEATVLLAADPRQLHDPETGIVPNNAGRGRLFERIAHALVFDRGGRYVDGEVALRVHDGDGIDRGRGTSFRIYLRPTRGLAAPLATRSAPLTPPPTRLVFDASRTAWWTTSLRHGARGRRRRAAQPGQVWLNGAFHNGW
jgi:hypothetical protein